MAMNTAQRRMARKLRYFLNFSVAFSLRRTPQTYQPYRGRRSNIGYPKKTSAKKHLKETNAAENVQSAWP